VDKWVNDYCIRATAGGQRLKIIITIKACRDSQNKPKQVLFCIATAGSRRKGRDPADIERGRRVRRPAAPWERK
jgi:hypothetical protein